MSTLLWIERNTEFNGNWEGDVSSIVADFQFFWLKKNCVWDTILGISFTDKAVNIFHINAFDYHFVHDTQHAQIDKN